MPQVHKGVAALFGYSVDSEVPLSRAGTGPNGRGALKIRCAPEELLAREGELVSWAEHDGAQFALATSGEDLLVWCSVTGSYMIRAAAGEIVTQRTGQREHWEHRLGATIVPLALAERGDLALHAAALVDGGKAVMFCGPPGRGKSTLTAALAINGIDVLSEDGAVISDPGGEPLTWPGQVGVRIAGDVVAAVAGGAAPNGQEKTTVLVGHRPGTGPAPVAAVVLLASPGGRRSEARRLDPVAALPAVMPHVLYGGPRRLAQALALVAQLATRVPVYRGRLPRDLERVGEHAQALLEQVRSESIR
jgi:hypothetical protein